jgi:hypothetical protein
MAQSIQTSKFGTLDTSGRIPVSLTGVGSDPALGLGLTFNVGGKDFTFIPEDRITQGAASGSNGALFTGFLNPTVLSNLQNASDYVDLSGVNFGSFDAGNFVAKNMGGSTKGFLAPKEVVDPVLSAGITQYDTSFAGRPTGIGNANGKPAYILPSGYADDSGKVTKTETKLVGYRISGGGGLLAGLGNEILKAGPIVPLALDVVGAYFGVPGIGTAVATGAAAGAIATGDEKTAANYAGQAIAGQLGIGSSVAGATGSTVAGQVAQGTAGGLLAGKNPEQAVTSAVKGVAFDSLRPDSGVTVPTEQQALAGQQDLQNQLAPYESSIPPSTAAFDTTQDISDTSGFAPPAQTPAQQIIGGNMAIYDEMNAPAIEMQDTTPYNYSPEEQQLIYQLAQEAGGTQNISDAYYALTNAAQKTADQSGLKVGDVLNFFKSNPTLTKGLVGAGVSTAGGLLTNQANVEAARISAQAMRDAAERAAEAQKFRPVGVTTRFGQSQFEFDPVTGQLKSAGYTVTPELKAMQDRIMALSGQGLTEAEKAAGRYAPLTAGAQGLFGLGQQYLAQTPEQVAADYMARQQSLLAPSREREFAQLQNRLFQTGRGGLSVGGTGMRPGGGEGLRAASPEMEAYYNAIAQQDAALAAQAQAEGQRQVQFGAGLMGTGANLLGAYGQGLTGAYSPFTTGIGVGAQLESLGQAPLDIGAQLGGRTAAAGANVGQSLFRGGLLGAQTTQAATGTSQFGDTLLSLAKNPMAQQALAEWLSGGTGYGTNTRQLDTNANF